MLTFYEPRRINTVNLFNNLWRDCLMPTNFKPNFDIKENNKDYTLIGEVPGFNKENLDITIEENYLTIKGIKSEDKEDYILQERQTGNFIRYFKLNETMDTDNIQAELKDGVLICNIPKKTILVKRVLIK